MRIVLISAFTLALYTGTADAGTMAAGSQPPAPARDSQVAPDNDASDTRRHARAAQRMARARHQAGQSTRETPSQPAGLPLSETVVQPTPAAPDPDPDR